MALRDDAVVLVAVGGAVWYFLKYMRDQTVNTVSDLIPALSPPGFTDLQKAMVQTDIQPAGNGTFTSGLLDYLTGQSGGIYALQPGDPKIYAVLSGGEWSESGITKTEMINAARGYYAQQSGVNNSWWPW